MSGKTIGVIVLVLVILILGWYVMGRSTVQAPTSTPTSSTSASSVAPTAPTNTSDAAISQDMANVDAQISGLNSDSASADTGLTNPNQ